MLVVPELREEELLLRPGVELLLPEDELPPLRLEEEPLRPDDVLLRSDDMLLRLEDERPAALDVERPLLPAASPAARAALAGVALLADANLLPEAELLRLDEALPPLRLEEMREELELLPEDRLEEERPPAADAPSAEEPLRF